MINLLPTDKKNILKKEYYIRLATVVFFLIFITIAVAGSLLVPAYFSLRAKRADALSVIAGYARDNQEEKKILEGVIATTNEKLDILKKENGSAAANVYGSIINTILSLRDTVRITEIVYEENRGGKRYVRVGGIAEDREDLRGFIKRLEGEVLFSRVNAPISSFVKDRDIEFSLEIFLP